MEEAIRSGKRRLESVLVARQRQDSRLQAILEACRAAGIQVRLESKDQLTRMARTEAHQGVVAVVAERGYSSLAELMQPRGEHLFLLALDGVEDPHNLGALLRTADGAGVDGVILPERRAAPVNATVVKTSAGAAEHVRIARVTNLVRAIEELKRANIWSLAWMSAAPRTTTPSITARTACWFWAARAAACMIWSAEPATTCCAFPWRARFPR